jgi:hypothetical protein
MDAIMPIAQNIEKRPTTIEMTQKRIVFIMPVNFDMSGCAVVVISTINAGGVGTIRLYDWSGMQKPKPDRSYVQGRQPGSLRLLRR